MSQNATRDLFSQHLIEALPYIREFSGKTVVVKFGGAAMLNDDLKLEFARDVVLLDYVGVRIVVVHGGGPKVSELMHRLGKTPEFIRGLRVTDKETVDIAEMVLAGLIGKEIVATINLEGGRAVGLSGKDAGLIRVVKQKLEPAQENEPALDLGYVGQIQQVNADVIRALDQAGFIPVIAPLGMGSDGAAYNINADTVAGELAAALRAERLVLLTDTPGILARPGDPSKLLSTLTPSQAKQLINAGIITGGMIPKVLACLRALEAGVGKTHIIDGRVPHSLLLELFTDSGIGTEITSNPPPGESS
jgi:acetylglutamate kinase